MDGFLSAGCNDYELMTEGWHERVIDSRNGVIYRSSGACAEFHLFTASSCTRIILLVSAPIILPGTCVTMRLSERSTLIGEITLEDAEWNLIDFPVSFKSRDVVSFRIQTYPTIIPDQILHNGDFRELGINLAVARLG